MSKKKIILIVISVILALVIVSFGLFAYFLFRTTERVSYDINEWNSLCLQKENTFLPSTDNFGEYIDLSCKHQHRDFYIFESDAYIVRATYTDNEFTKQMEYIEENYQFKLRLLII